MIKKEGRTAQIATLCDHHHHQQQHMAATENKDTHVTTENEKRHLERLEEWMFDLSKNQKTKVYGEWLKECAVSKSVVNWLLMPA